MTTLMLYRDAFTSLGETHKWGHTYALAIEPDGSVVVYCGNCDQDQHDPKPTHCCPNEPFVCDDCSQTEWWDDICCDRYERYVESRLGWC